MWTTFFTILLLLLLLQMPQDKANCVPNALLAQLNHLPANMRAINVRAAMVIELLVHEETIWVTTI